MRATQFILASGSALCAFALAPAMAGEAVTYEADGNSYEGYYAPASEESRGLVLVIHDWDGLTEYEQERADMLAEMGYHAFAVDLYGAGNRPETTEARQAETARLYEDRELMRALITAGLEAARGEAGDGPAVVMGYCFGGAGVLEMARSIDAENIAGYATFHGTLETPEGQAYDGDTAPILISHGGADTSVPLSDAVTLTEELEEAGVTYELEVYSGAPHAFTVFGSDRYRELADETSWTSFTNFLERNLADG